MTSSVWDHVITYDHAESNLPPLPPVTEWITLVPTATHTTKGASAYKNRYNIGDELRVIRQDFAYSPLAVVGLEFRVLDIRPCGAMGEELAYGFNLKSNGLYYVKELCLDYSRPEGDDWI